MVSVMASSVKVGLGSIAFAIFWVLAVFPAVPFLPIGRTAGSLLGAMLMVIFQVITPHEAYAAIDLPILGLLFGTMVVSIYLERADIFAYLGKLLSWKSRGAKDLLCRICLISAVSSALFTNDTTCVILTEFVLKIARQHNLPPHPLLLALASSANIGSSASPIGNPQNLVIAVQSKISFSSFVFGVLPAMLVGAVVNASIIVCMYWKLLTDNDMSEENSNLDDVPDEEVISHRFSPATMSHYRSFSSKDWVPGIDQVSQIGEDSNSRVGVAPIQGLQGAYLRLPSEENEGCTKSSEHRLFWKSCVYLVAIGMLISLLVGLDMSWTALTAALALMVIDFKDATPCLEKVSYSLLIFFCGMFITVDGYNRTGVPSTFWDLTKPYAQIDHASGVVVLAVVILVLSNLASNVPTVLLLGGRVAASAASISAAQERKAWLILAWVSTVAGNLSLLGSAANLIVCEQASRSTHFGYSLSFWTHLKFGFPSTLIVTAVGLLLIN